ncbi:MAG: ABC-type phosphate/phosphonate transport system substrate-binding protein [Gammaproteobacteria bacterium]
MNPSTKLQSTPNDTGQYVSCGMYSFNSSLQVAWQTLFNEFFELENIPSTFRKELLDESNFKILTDPDLLLGHTCGYPLMETYQSYLAPVCVPVFSVPGVNNRHYCSFFITAKDSDIECLNDCKNRIAAINGPDSNSGMNVLRHAVGPLANQSCFFSDVLVSGGHWDSVIAVSESRADVAAIDCVTFALLKDHQPDLIDSVKIIGSSTETCGLPFVIPLANDDVATRQRMIDSLNTALSKLDHQTKSTLHLERFEPVSLSDYQFILDIEDAAIQKGYPVLC